MPDAGLFITVTLPVVRWSCSSGEYHDATEQRWRGSRLTDTPDLVRSVSSPVLAAIAARAFAMTGALLMSVAIMRTLPPHEAGLIILVYTVLTVASMVARAGVDTICLVEVSKHHGKARALLRQAWLVTAIATPPVAVATFLVLAWQGRSTSGDLSVALAAAVAVLPSALAVTIAAMLRALDHVASGAMADVGSPTMIASVLIAGLGMTHHATSARVAWAITVGYLLTLVWSCLLLWTKMPAGEGGPVSLRDFLDQHGSQLPYFMINSIGFFLLSWLPILVLGFTIFDPERARTEVALYNAGARLSQFVSVITTVQIAYLSQRFAHHFFRREVAVVNRLAQRAATQSLIWGGLLGLAFFVFPSTFLNMFGGYGDAAAGLRVLTVGAFAVVVLGPVNGLMLTCGLERQAGIYTAVLVACGVVALPVLARGGYVPVAAGYSISSLVYALACRKALRGIGIHLRPALRRGRA